MSKNSNKYMGAFIDEAKEQLQSLNTVLLNLETDGYNEEHMSEAYRIVHTIKGTANVVGVTRMGSLAHIMEDLFDLLRDKKEDPERELLDILFESSDTLDDMLSELINTGEVTTDESDLVSRLKDHANKDTVKKKLSKKAV